MRRVPLRECTRILLPLLLLFIPASCASGPDMAGTWREIGREATIEFSGHGTFRAVDNEGMAVDGTYCVPEKGNLRFVINHEGGPDEVVDLRFSISGDVLTLTAPGPDRAETERYRREE